MSKWRTRKSDMCIFFAFVGGVIGVGMNAAVAVAAAQEGCCCFLLFLLCYCS